MTPRVPAAFRRARPALAGGQFRARRRALFVISGVALLMLVGLPSPAAAQWGKLEKLSGPGPFTGFASEFRLACFGPPVKEIALAEALTASAATTIASVRSRGSADDPGWMLAADAWTKSAEAWATIFGEKYAPESTVQRDIAEKAEAAALNYRLRVEHEIAPRSAAGVFWSFCSPTKDWRIGLDFSVNTLSASGRDYYAGGASIKLDTLMTSVTWRLLAETKADYVDVSTGGGVYWFSSRGFPSQSGVVLQPIRFTFRAPPSWGSRASSVAKRLATIPSYAFALTMFPAGFEPDDFAGTGDRAVRLPRELVPTQYVFVSIQPLLELLRK